MRTETRRIELPDGSIKHTAAVIDDADPDGKNWRRMSFMRLLADNPAVLMVGGMPFASCHIQHDGVSWRADLEAIEPRRK